MTRETLDHVEVIAEEVLKRRDLLWDTAGTRQPNQNHKRTEAWKEIRRIVFNPVPQKSPCSYRNATGGGVNKALEEALAKGLGSMSEADEKIARALGPEAAPPSECSDPGASQVLQQLSTFESDSDTDCEEIPRKRGRKTGVREAFLEEQTRYIRAKRLYLEKKYALLTKVDTLLEKIQINVYIQPNNGAVHNTGQRTTKTDTNIEKSLLSSQV
ncbi:unnamed protein product [Cylicocyclus nassatus]|uniref:Uncharacterized protein n=1 Tax=Cylicocyclus nassatus TaxID=53992 RepID=A0AA36GM45_CYLNA|nr:unnamed protein product [Cylicocyclus nassatus]